MKYCVSFREEHQKPDTEIEADLVEIAASGTLVFMNRTGQGDARVLVQAYASGVWSEVYPTEGP